MKKQTALMFSLIFMGGVLSGCGQDVSDTTVSVNTQDDLVEVTTNAPLFQGYTSPDVQVPAGSTVLTFSSSAVEEALADTSNVGGVYYAHTLVEAGPMESTVVDAFDEEFSTPNELIIGIAPGQSAAAKDILLTTWQSGSGMERAVAVDAGITPSAYYLDLAYDYAAASETPDVLAEDSFAVLSKGTDLQVGKTVMCEDDMTQGIVTSISGSYLLTSEWAGTIAMHAVSDCDVLDPYATFEVGETVLIAPFGTYDEEGTITKVDEVTGRAWVSYEFAGEMTEEVIAFMNIAKM